jgi:Flp pilus assembly protein TadB
VTRIGDLEREAARARLVEAYAAGRIDAPELESRAETVWGAARSAELAAVIDDLGEDPAPPRGAGPRLVRDLLVFLTCGAIAVLVWHLTGRGFFWPVWVLVYTGLPLLRLWRD